MHLTGVYREHVEVCTIFNEVVGALRREIAAEQENPLAEKATGNLPLKLIVFSLLLKSIISRIQSILGAVRPSRDIKRLNSKFVTFQPVSTISKTVSITKMWSDQKNPLNM